MGWRSTVGDAWDGLWGLAIRNLLFPEFCALCNIRLLTEDNHHFCPTCWESSPRIERPFCSVCGRPHPRGVGMMGRHNFPCGACAAQLPKLPYRRVVGAAHYAGAVEEAVKRFKFHGKLNLTEPLAALLEETVTAELDPDAYDWLVPVPLHRVRQRERGYNQALVLAEALMPVFSNARIDQCLRRIRPTHTQSRIKDPAERRRNVRGAFAIEGASHLKGGAVLLLDDVITTHGTVEECARILRQVGVAHVDVLAIALATSPHEKPPPA